MGDKVHKLKRHIIASEAILQHYIIHLITQHGYKETVSFVFRESQYKQYRGIYLRVTLYIAK